MVEREAVEAGRTITCEVTLTDVEERDERTALDTEWRCTNEADEVVLTGESSGVVFG